MFRWMKKHKKCKNNESLIFTMMISMKVAFFCCWRRKFSTVVNGGDILDFHFFEALNDNFEV